MKIYQQIAANKWKTVLIMVLFIIFITTLAFVFQKALGYGLGFTGLMLVISGIFSFGSYYFSDQLVLATAGAKPMQKKDNPELYRIVENLCIGDGLPMPRIYIMNETSPNAFATGRDPKHAVVCVTSGLLQKMDKSELEGVIAHELSHVKNFDTRLMGIVAILVGFIAIIADMFMRSMWFGGMKNRDNDRDNNSQYIFILIGIIFAILSPIIATIIQLAISRKREYLADASGALLTRYPEGLASALAKIANDPTTVRGATNATAHLFIANPFKGKDAKTWFSSLFDTHPPIEDRIKILRSM
ncbi:MAG TPA: M48 family metalloprotease [Candidatus Saccharimonadales bacterium]|nr:M48 family metalloprotease [Candidatus Saccharimonadales bacterium]